MFTLLVTSCVGRAIMFHETYRSRAEAENAKYYWDNCLDIYGCRKYVTQIYKGTKK